MKRWIKALDAHFAAEPPIIAVMFGFVIGMAAGLALVTLMLMLGGHA